jgi:hypothetical protein
MPPDETVRSLLAGGARAAEEERHSEARKAARVAWVTEMMVALFAAQDRVTKAWDQIFEALPDDLDEEELDAIPVPPEQAELDLIFEQLHAVRDHDRWPRELYFKNI